MRSVVTILGMWKVEFESLAVRAEIEKMIESGLISKSDEQIIEAWARQIAAHGPESVQGNRKWNDHALTGEWNGYRSSSFSNRGRIIYRIVNKKILIKVARVTPDHDYRKRGKK